MHTDNHAVWALHAVQLHCSLSAAQQITRVLQLLIQPQSGQRSRCTARGRSLHRSARLQAVVTAAGRRWLQVHTPRARCAQADLHAEPMADQTEVLLSRCAGCSNTPGVLFGLLCTSSHCDQRPLEVALTCLRAARRAWANTREQRC